MTLTLVDVLNPRLIIDGRCGADTKALYAFLDGLGPKGELATALFRAQKRSTFAKGYRSREYRRNAYDVKMWSLGEICRIMALFPEALPYAYGWKVDPGTTLHGGMAWVLYIDLPCGQASFHAPRRHHGPDFAGKWIPGHGSRESVLKFCESVMQEACFGPEGRQPEGSAA